MNKLLKGALISSFIVALYGISFHAINISPNDWETVAMWLPVYISPIWAIAGASHLSERGKE